MLWLRGFHYVYMCYFLIKRAYYDPNSALFFKPGCTILALFLVFNFNAVIIPFYKRTVKWFKKSIVLEKEKPKEN